MAAFSAKTMKRPAAAALPICAASRGKRRAGARLSMRMNSTRRTNPTTAAAELPTALADRYETLRTRLKGTGAARLIRSRCDGCHLELSSGEVERIRGLPHDEVATCEQCGRILVPV